MIPRLIEADSFACEQCPVHSTGGPCARPGGWAGTLLAFRSELHDVGETPSPVDTPQHSGGLKPARRGLRPYSVVGGWARRLLSGTDLLGAQSRRKTTRDGSWRT